MSIENDFSKESFELYKEQKELDVLYQYMESVYYKEAGVEEQKKVQEKVEKKEENIFKRIWNKIKSLCLKLWNWIKKKFFNLKNKFYMKMEDVTLKQIREIAEFVKTQGFPHINLMDYYLRPSFIIKIKDGGASDIQKVLETSIPGRSDITDRLFILITSYIGKRFVLDAKRINQEFAEKYLEEFNAKDLRLLPLELVNEIAALDNRNANLAEQYMYGVRIWKDRVFSVSKVVINLEEMNHFDSEHPLTFYTGLDERYTKHLPAHKRIFQDELSKLVRSIQFSFQVYYKFYLDINTMNRIMQKKWYSVDEEYNDDFDNA